LPGSPKAAKECLTAIAPAIPHAIDLILDNKAKIKDTHDIAHLHIASCLKKPNYTDPVRHFFFYQKQNNDFTQNYVIQLDHFR